MEEILRSRGRHEEVMKAGRASSSFFITLLTRLAPADSSHVNVAVVQDGPKWVPSVTQTTGFCDSPNPLELI